ncbi:MAG: rhomboid family intramembrane serine protease [Muribaculaceae bacterium]|nr:rhomboid family intramembrane serine protease [Muribaculaceae bacterium]
MAIIDDLKTRYSQGSMLMRFIYINIAVFVVLHVLTLISLLLGIDTGWPLRLVEVPTDWQQLLRRPWTLVTYMFAHYEMLHILFNMLWFYWLGRIFLEFFMPRQLGGLYVLGGLGGAAFFVLAYNLLPHFAGQPGMLLGASASVIAIVVAAAVYAPDYKIGLLFIGEISLKWVAIITVGIDLLSFDTGNAGGHIAHLGGALTGALWALNIKRGHDITNPINTVIDIVVGAVKRLGSKKQGGSGGVKAENVSSEHQSARQESRAQSVDEERLDRILAKIKQSGYTALTDDEKDFLFNASRKR